MGFFVGSIKQELGDWFEYIGMNCVTLNFDVLLTVHLSIILVINQRNAQNLVL